LPSTGPISVIGLLAEIQKSQHKRVRYFNGDTHGGTRRWSYRQKRRIKCRGKGLTDQRHELIIRIIDLEHNPFLGVIGHTVIAIVGFRFELCLIDEIQDPGLG
jgi:hypothetical protein